MFQDFNPLFASFDFNVVIYGKTQRTNVGWLEHYFQVSLYTD